MMKWLTLLIILLSANAFAWSEADTERQTLFFILAAADGLQTLEIVEHGRKETNPFLTERPSKGRVYAFTASAMLGHYLIARALSDKNRALWQMFWIGVESNAIKNNYQAGIRIHF